MSYIVPDKIPSYCAECDWSICLYPNAYCKRVHKTSELLMAIEKRPDFCPLIEIPTPHGRLGDLDALIKTLEQNRLCYVLDIDDESFELGIDKAISIVKEVPTVIEAED